MRPLTPAPGAPPLTAPAPAPTPGRSCGSAPSLSIDARALVITADGTDAAFEAITSTLGFLGTPYDVLNATTGPTLTAAALADGDHGKYQAIFLDVGDLSVNGASAFTTRRMDGAGDLRGALRRPARRALHLSERCLRSGVERRLREPRDESDPDPLQRRGCDDAGGDELRQRGHHRRRAGRIRRAPRTRRRCRCSPTTRATSTRRSTPTPTDARRWRSRSRRRRTRSTRCSSVTAWSAGRRAACSSASATPTCARRSTICFWRARSIPTPG